MSFFFLVFSFKLSLFSTCPLSLFFLYFSCYSSYTAFVFALFLFFLSPSFVCSSSSSFCSRCAASPFSSFSLCPPLCLLALTPLSLNCHFLQCSSALLFAGQSHVNCVCSFTAYVFVCVTENALSNEGNIRSRQLKAHSKR